MPNWCFTDYVIAGDENEISDLYYKLSSLPEKEDVHKSDFGKFWLGNVIELFGGNWEKINCRGRLHDLEKRCRTEISFRTVTAWGLCPVGFMTIWEETLIATAYQLGDLPKLFETIYDLCKNANVEMPENLH